jgi:hypothetical protein
MKWEHALFIANSVFVFLGIILGICLTISYQTVHTERTINGLWMSQYNENDAREAAQEMDQLEDWICININGMTIDDIIQTCNHEAAHELFAEKCEDNASKCFVAIENINKT